MQADNEKHIFRQMLFSRRNALPSIVRMEKSKRISERMIALVSQCNWQSEHLLLAYAPFRSEVDIHGVFEWCWREQVGVAVPRAAADHQLAWYRLTAYDQLVPGAYNIMEPDPNVCPQVQNYADVRCILIPGVGFDEQGGRLGYGGGYYDRFLSRLPDAACKIAAAFEEQVVEEIPLDAHDYRMDQIVTDERVIIVNRNCAGE